MVIKCIVMTVSTIFVCHYCILLYRKTTYNIVILVPYFTVWDFYSSHEPNYGILIRNAAIYIALHAWPCEEMAYDTNTCYLRREINNVYNSVESIYNSIIYTLNTRYFLLFIIICINYIVFLITIDEITIVIQSIYIYNLYE